MHATQMDAVASALAISRYDLLVVADGSGTRMESSCGWACYLYDPGTAKVWEHVGGVSGGTNNYAELAPFVHALWHWHYTHFPAGSLKRPVDVRAELVSDSELTVRCGNGLYARNAALPLWASIDWFCANGYRLHWNHVPRNSIPPHEQADRRGREMRHLIEEYVAA